MAVKMAKVVEKAKELNNDVEAVKTELRKVQSVKCRLKKQKAKATYEAEMREVVALEQLLKEVREYLSPAKVTVTTMTQEQIDLLSYDDTVKAIKSIQSKKCNVQYATERLEDNVEYQEAVRIEKMLQEHRKKVKPIEDNVIKKSDLNAELERLAGLGLTPEQIIEELKKLTE